MSTFLWEIGCEDIPARMQAGAMMELQRHGRKAAQEQGVTFRDLDVWVTPRRLSMRLVDVDKVVWPAVTKTGPLVEQGEEAFMRFCTKWGIQPHHGVMVTTPKGLAWSAVVTPPDTSLAERLCALCEAVMHNVVWPKRMVWDQQGFSWIRPIRWMVCLLDDQVVPWTWHGVVADRWTEAHRLAGIPEFHASQATDCQDIHQHDAHGHHVHAQDNHPVDHGAERMTETAIPLSQNFKATDVMPAETPSSLASCTAHEKSKREEEHTVWTPGGSSVALGSPDDKPHLILHPGHRRWGVLLERAEHYEETLQSVGVMIASSHRHEHIRREIVKAAAHVGGGIHQATAEELVEENVGLTQWPQAILCAFDPAFLALPLEVIVTTLQVHQRCFAVTHGDDSQVLLPYFIMIADGALRPSPLRQGYERVVAARLQDALYFWEQDGKIPLLQRRQALKERVFFAGLGSLYDKTERSEHLMTWMAHHTGHTHDLPALRDLVRISKSDLLTAMVGEFPTLQGIMGSYYAQQQGYDKTLALALCQPYRLARLPMDQLSTHTTRWGAWLTIADGMDTLVGFFALGRKPTGSKDPLALRRTCHGVIKGLLMHGHGLSLPALLAEVITAYRHQGLLGEDALATQESALMADWWNFFVERLEFIMKEGGVVLPSPALAILKTVLQAGGDVPTLWHQAQHHQRVHRDYPQAIKAYDRLRSLIQSRQDDTVVSAERNGLTTPWEQKALDSLQTPMSLDRLGEWAVMVEQLLDHVSVQDPAWGGQRLGLFMDLVHAWSAWMPLGGSFSVG